MKKKAQEIEKTRIDAGRAGGPSRGMSGMAGISSMGGMGGGGGGMGGSGMGGGMGGSDAAPSYRPDPSAYGAKAAEPARGAPKKGMQVRRRSGCWGRGRGWESAGQGAVHCSAILGSGEHGSRGKHVCCELHSMHIMRIHLLTLLLLPSCLVLPALPACPGVQLGKKAGGRDFLESLKAEGEHVEDVHAGAAAGACCARCAPCSLWCACTCTCKCCCGTGCGCCDKGYVAGRVLVR